MTLPDRFYPIAGTAEEVRLVVETGARFVQLRVKDQSNSIIRDEIEKALSYCRSFQAQLVVNDYWELALEQGASYLHLGQEDLQQADLNRIRQAGVKLGISTHSHDELRNALSCKPDYIALGPIWETRLKVMPWRPQGLERVREWSERIHPIPLVAIGGITQERSRSCLEAGAASVAVVSDVFRHSDPRAQAQKWQQALYDNDFR